MADDTSPFRELKIDEYEEDPSKLSLTNIEQQEVEEEKEQEEEKGEQQGHEKIEEKDDLIIEAEIEAEIETEQVPFETLTQNESDNTATINDKSSPVRSPVKDKDYKEERFYDNVNSTNKNDFKSARSRVFVGHLNSIRATREEMRTLFGKCGPINSVSILNGYGFVQFDSEESALKAIATIHGHYFHGMRLGGCGLIPILLTGIYLYYTRHLI